VKLPTGEPTGLHRETPVIPIEAIPLIMKSYLIGLYNRPSAPLIVGNTGDSGFVATAVGWEPNQD
jgi:hypothetical protein